VQQVQRTDVESCRHRDLRAETRQLLGKVEARLAVVKASVDVRRDNIDQARRLHHVSQLDHQTHGHRHPGTVLTGEFCLILTAQGQIHRLSSVSDRTTNR
jgi:hypothetical protein